MGNMKTSISAREAFLWNLEKEKEMLG